MSPAGTPHDDEARTGAKSPGRVAQAGAGVASLAEAWLRDTVMYGVVLLSLGVVLAGFAGDNGTGPAVAGTVVGLAAAVAAVVPTVRHWRPSRIWAAMSAVAVIDVAVILLLVST